MARREALLTAARTRVEGMQAEFFRSAPLTSRGWSSTAPTLADDGRLRVTVHERDEYGRDVEAFTLVSELDGTISQTQVPPLPDDIGPERPVRRGTSEPTYDELAGLAEQYLGGAVARDWLEHVAPAVRLDHAQPGELVAAQLGGAPMLPINTWPVWPGHGPLSHIISLDCSKLAPLLPRLGLPESGLLSFFYFDGQFDDHRATVGSWDATTQAGSRTLWFDADAQTPPELAPVLTQPPTGLKPFPAIPLTPIPTLTWPIWEHVELRRLWAAHGLEQPMPGVPPEPVDALYDAIRQRHNGHPSHQVGGHALPEQSAVEMDLAAAALHRSGVAEIDYESPEFEAHERGWKLLLQVDTDDDADMMWGDVGKLYFLIQPADLEAGNFGDVGFTWQCG